MQETNKVLLSELVSSRKDAKATSDAAIIDHKATAKDWQDLFLAQQKQSHESTTASNTFNQDLIKSLASRTDENKHQVQNFTFILEQADMIVHNMFKIFR